MTPNTQNFEQEDKEIELPNNEEENTGIHIGIQVNIPRGNLTLKCFSKCQTILFKQVSSLLH